MLTCCQVDRMPYEPGAAAHLDAPAVFGAVVVNTEFTTLSGHAAGSLHYVLRRDGTTRGRVDALRRRSEGIPALSQL
jgi:hypothetical protein